MAKGSTAQTVCVCWSPSAGSECRQLLPPAAAPVKCPTLACCSWLGTQQQQPERRRQQQQQQQKASAERLLHHSPPAATTTTAAAKFQLLVLVLSAVLFSAAAPANARILTQQGLGSAMPESTATGGGSNSGSSSTTSLAIWQPQLQHQQQPAATFQQWHSSPAPNPCSTTLCRNAGTCRPILGGQSATCQCVYGYSGPYCEIGNACLILSNPCRNGGTCVSSGASSTSYLCQCPYGYFGQNCELKDACRLQGGSACRNNGQCMNLGGGGYACNCPVGYSGLFCDEFNPCAVPGNLCVNGGVCIQAGSRGFRCSCPPGFTGQRCEVAVPRQPWQQQQGSG